MMPQNSQIKRWIWPVRITWSILFFILLIFFIGGIPYRYAELVAPCTGEGCTVLTITRQEMALLAQMGLSPSFYATFHILVESVVAFFMVMPAVLFVWRRFDDAMGIFMAFFLLLLGLNFMVEIDGAFARQYPLLQSLLDFLTALSAVPLLLLFFIFPNGRFVPRWARYVAFFTVAVSLLDPLLKLFTLSIPSGQFSLLVLVVILLNLVLGILSQIYRYRYVSNQHERQQTKWVLFGFSLLLVVVLTYSFTYELFSPPPGSTRLLTFTALYGFLAVFLVAFPLTIVIAIVRHNLYDVDLIIRRTLLYTLTTGLLALVYFTSVVLIQGTITAVGGQPSQAVIILSTLLIAALFNPLRRRLQSAIDKRFYRSKYDAQQTLARFAATARDEVDLEKLSAELVSVIQETMQPEQISLWLRPTLRK